VSGVGTLAVLKSAVVSTGEYRWMPALGVTSLSHTAEGWGRR